MYTPHDKLEITEVSSHDAFYIDRDILVGRTGHFEENAIPFEEPEFLAGYVPGRFIFDDSVELHLYVSREDVVMAEDIYFLGIKVRPVVKEE